MLIPVILCGGSGTRLWPLSRQDFPKQFAPIMGGKNLLEITLNRLAGQDDDARRDTICVTGEDHRFLVAEAMAASGVSGSIILEPLARNTAAAMALAALHRQTGPKDDLLLFCPSDHHIPDVIAFEQTVQKAIPVAQGGSIVTFGIVPNAPSTAYGYILQGPPEPDGSRLVSNFIEKPDEALARELLAAGNALWNAGIFLMSAHTLLAALNQHAPDILASCRQAMAGITTETMEYAPGRPLHFRDEDHHTSTINHDAPTSTIIHFLRPEEEPLKHCRSQSIDYAVMEKQQDIRVVPFQGQWSDMGNWNSIAKLTPVDEAGNRIHGQGIAHLAQDTYIHAPHRPVVALGTSDLLIIDTPDALLVADTKKAEQVKDALKLLEQAGYVQAGAHRRVARPWGWYDRVDAGENFQIKRIGVRPGASLSLQKHLYRAEHWIVTRGTAEVTCGAKTFLLSENQSTYTPIGEIHRLHNPGDTELEIVEVQSGTYLGEDDIVRLEDTYRRTPC